MITEPVGTSELADYAETAKISVKRARTHLKHVLEKTGHHRQIDLVTAIMGDPLMKLAPGAISDGRRGRDITPSSAAQGEQQPSGSRSQRRLRKCRSANDPC